MSVPTAKAKNLVSEQANQHAYSSAMGQLAIVILICTQLAAIINHELLLPWCLTLVFLIFVKIILAWSYRTNEPKNMAPWLNSYTVIMLLTGVTWACFGLFYLTVDDVVLKYLFFVIICGMAAAAVPILAAWTPAYYANTFPQFISWPAILLYSGTITSTVLAILFFIYCFMLIRIQRNTKYSIRNAFLSEHENDDLFVDQITC